MQYVDLEVDHFKKTNVKACRHRIRLRHKSDLIAHFFCFSMTFSKTFDEIFDKTNNEIYYDSTYFLRKYIRIYVLYLKDVCYMIPNNNSCHNDTYHIYRCQQQK